MAFKLFKKKNLSVRQAGKKRQLQDLNGTPLMLGDKVECLRYDMGESILIEGENGFEYESIKTKQKVSFAKMIDAANSFQKVRKLD
ncbi:MAG: hypothetical protein PF485_02305 [Bacteroidales bacterium]|jgi:hypothetical protein|nr:hypothetical protein [Bacteroidales bacterium]